MTKTRTKSKVTSKKGKKRQHHQAPPRVIHKKKWVDMEMYRVPLNHEQAVLTCCESVYKGQAGSIIQCGLMSCPHHPGYHDARS